MKDIEVLREEIDKIDTQIVQLLSQRFELSSQIGAIKKRNNIPVVDSKRWSLVKERLKKEAKKHNLNENLVDDLYELIHKHSVLGQEG
jgi:chorismate mutase